MIDIKTDWPLKNYNTFGINVKAKFFSACETIDEIHEILSDQNFRATEHLILGGGSNILFSDDYRGFILHVAMKGKEIIEEDDTHVRIKAAAGENWDDFVAFCTKNGYYGLENLSLIPGNVGASPIQNIGAYGSEVKDFIESVEAIGIENGDKMKFTRNECKFGYRDSIFKKIYKNKLIITSVIFRLDKIFTPVTSYGNIEAEWGNYPEKSAKTLREAVISIRRKKLPDPLETGNAGSFFKNPVIDTSLAVSIIESHPGIPHYENENGNIKFPAAWMIEKCGWKGKTLGDAGVHPKQPLVLVNYGNASGKEIITLGAKIQDSVKSMFGIELEREVNVIGNL